MDSKRERIFKLEDKSRLKISVKLELDYKTQYYRYDIQVSHALPKKQMFKMVQKADYTPGIEDKIYLLAVKLYRSLEPSKANLKLQL